MNDQCNSLILTKYVLFKRSKLNLINIYFYQMEIPV